MRAPNLLFLMSDQQRADTIAPDSPCLTPHLNRLATSGARFERCYAPNPICSPTRASMMTGTYPHTHGMVDCTHTVEPYRAEFKTELPLWSQALQAAGYRTGYFGKWHIERTNQLERFGFDQYEVDHEGYLQYRRELGLSDKAPALSESFHVTQKGYKDFLLYGVTDEAPESMYEYYLYSRGIEFLEGTRNRPEEPWALFISTDGPHDPYIVPRESYSRYNAESLEPPQNFEDTLADRPAIYRRARGVWADMEAANYREATACYYAFCSLIDDQVGRILSVLDSTGQTNNTLIIYTSDHGDYMGAHGLMLKGIPPFEEIYRVPLILSGPGVPKGATIGGIASLVDLGASIVPLLLGEPFPCEGRSLVPLLQGTASDWVDEAFAECHGQRFFYTQRILWQERYKYVFNGFDEDELYDLAEDPYEMQNLSGVAVLQPIIEQLATRMWQIIRDTGDFNMYESQYGMFRFAPVGPEATVSQATGLAQ